MNLEQYKLGNVTPIEKTFIAQYKQMNNLAIEPLFNNLLGKRNLIPKVDKYIDRGLDLAKARLGLDRAKIKKYNYAEGIEHYNQIAGFEQIVFEKATKDRLANTYLSRIIELVIADALIEHFKVEYLSNISIYSDIVLDTVFGVDLVLMIADTPFYIHVTKTRDIQNDMREQITKNYPVRAKNKPFNIKGWVSHKRDYSNHLWCFYDDLCNIQIDELIQQIENLLEKGYSDDFYQIVLDSDYDYITDTETVTYGHWTQLELFIYEMNRTKLLRDYEPSELVIPSNLDAFKADKVSD